jgi:hypothetical protein
MKGIAPSPVRSLPLAAVAMIACTMMSPAQRQVLEADAESFETIVRSQISDSTSGSLGFLRVDARPGRDDAVLSGASPEHRGLELSDSSDSPDSLARLLGAAEDQRRSILGALKVDGGGPFSYPFCGGARRVSDSAAVNGDTKCPREPVRYVTVGIPYRGAAPVLDKLRSPESPVPDSTAELWTVLVSETNIGPGGQQWRQYAWLFRREEGSGRLAPVERFLVSWAE